VADQATGSVEPHGTGHALEHNPGKRMSWVAISVIIVGFLVGAIALVPHPTWWAFWLGVGIAVVGCVMTLFAKTFRDDWY
jgi:hypothetical protein